MPSRRIHVSLDVHGALFNWRDDDPEWSTSVHDRDGRLLNPREVKTALLDLLANGIRRIPFGEPCEGFDPVTGCPGHDLPESEATSA